MTFSRWILTIAVFGGGLHPTTICGAARPAPALIEAAQQNDVTAVRALLRQRIDANSAASDGTTPLHWAARHDNVEMVSLLLRRGAKVESMNRFGITPLWLASSDGHTAVVTRLLDAGADPNTNRADSGETVLLIAARGGYVDTLKVLLAHGANVNAKERVRGQTALMWAAAERHAEAVQVLIDAGANLTARSSTEMTPLMFAIRAGDLETTGRLLDAGADLSATASDGTTMLVLAILNARFELAAALLERGADPNGNDPHGRPLHVLTWMRRADNRGLSKVIPRTPSGNLDSFGLANALLARGATINDQLDWVDPGIAGQNGVGQVYSPKHMAIGSLRSLSLVGATPFYLAAMNGDVPFMRFLASHGADPQIMTRQKVTPLLAAAGIGYTIGETAGTEDEAFEAVKLAFELGNDPRAIVDFGDYNVGVAGWNGATALHGAVIRGANALAEWLVEKGVPLDHRTAVGQTALMLAEGSNLGLTFHVQPELATRLRTLMNERGISISSVAERSPLQR